MLDEVEFTIFLLFSLVNDTEQQIVQNMWIWSINLKVFSGISQYLIDSIYNI